jgi:acetyl-CoA C-acetyltransferase
MAIDPQTPILVGVGQIVRHWDGQDIDDAPSPLGLQLAAAERALADSGAGEALRQMIDGVVVVRANHDSIEGVRHPFGRCANPPVTLAAGLGIGDARCIYSVVGGDQPQALVNEAAEAIFAGDAKAILLAGSEAIATMKQALKARLTLDWSYSVDGPWEDRGLGPSLLTDYERVNGLGMPTQTYPAFEQALRARLGLIGPAMSRSCPSCGKAFRTSRRRIPIRNSRRAVRAISSQRRAMPIIRSPSPISNGTSRRMR